MSLPRSLMVSSDWICCSSLMLVCSTGCIKTVKRTYSVGCEVANVHGYIVENNDYHTALQIQYLLVLSKALPSVV